MTPHCPAAAATAAKAAATAVNPRTNNEEGVAAYLEQVFFV